jgi:hypothetical protein
MNRLLLLLILGLLISGCSKKQKQLDNEKYILGDWINVAFENKNQNGVSFSLPPIYDQGFTFYKNYSFVNKAGYFSRQGWGKEVFLGTLSNFQITGDSLLLLNKENKTWDNYRIFKLTPDSLKFGVDGSINVYKHVIAKTNKTPAFDKIILSTSDCFGPCPILNIAVDKDGKVIFRGVRNTSKDGLYEGSISKKYYQYLQNSFRRMDFDSLKDTYISGVSDGQTVTTTFLRNGNIYKTVYDYRRIAPSLFRWAYLPLEYLYQNIPLKKIAYPDFMVDFEFVTNLSLTKGDSILELKQSETFLLFEFLRKAKIVNQGFKPRFKIHSYFEINSSYDITTDGRFYIFLVKGKPVTIDIGFNFYDVNAKTWQWRKAGEYE